MRYRKQRKILRYRGNGQNSIYLYRGRRWWCRFRLHSDRKSTVYIEKVIQRRRNIYLEFSPSPVNPLGIVCHTVNVRKGFDSHFDLPSIIENTAVTVHEVYDGGEGVVSRSVAENGIVPALEVWVILDECWKGIPFVFRGDEEWTVCSGDRDLGGRRFKCVCWPSKRCVCGGNKCRGRECCCICLYDQNQHK